MIGIVYNPSSRKGTSRNMMDELLSVLDSRHVDYDFRVSEHPRDSIMLAKELAKTCDTIVAAGGDGTVFEVVNGSIDSDVSYAIFPCGTGNDISRTLYDAEPTPEQIADVLVGSNIKKMDCFIVNDEYISIQFASLGCVAAIVENVNKRKKVSKTVYTGSMLKGILQHRSKKYTIIDDCGEKRYSADFISVQNVPTVGGGVLMNGEIKSDDGYLDFILVEHKSLWQIIRNGLALVRGKISGQSNVTTKRIKSIEIRNDEEQICCIDGEIFTVDHVKIQLYPKQIKFKY